MTCEHLVETKRAPGDLRRLFFEWRIERPSHSDGLKYATERPKRNPRTPDLSTTFSTGVPRLSTTCGPANSRLPSNWMASGYVKNVASSRRNGYPPFWPGGPSHSDQLQRAPADYP